MAIPILPQQNPPPAQVNPQLQNSFIAQPAPLGAAGVPDGIAPASGAQQPEPPHVPGIFETAVISFKEKCLIPIFGRALRLYAFSVNLFRHIRRCLLRGYRQFVLRSSPAQQPAPAPAQPVQPAATQPPQLAPAQPAQPAAAQPPQPAPAQPAQPAAARPPQPAPAQPVQPAAARQRAQRRGRRALGRPSLSQKRGPIDIRDASLQQVNQNRRGRSPNNLKANHQQLKESLLNRFGELSIDEQENIYFEIGKQNQPLAGMAYWTTWREAAKRDHYIGVGKGLAEKNPMLLAIHLKE